MSTWCEELTHWKRPWCWERLKAGGEGEDREWDGWMASLTQWTWVWASSGSWWWTRKPGVLQSMGSQRVTHNWVTKLTDWQCILQLYSKFFNVLDMAKKFKHLPYFNSPDSYLTHWNFFVVPFYFFIEFLMNLLKYYFEFQFNYLICYENKLLFKKKRQSKLDNNNNQDNKVIKSHQRQRLSTFWKVVSVDAGVLGLQRRRIQSRANQQGWITQSFCAVKFY